MSDFRPCYTKALADRILSWWLSILFVFLFSLSLSLFAFIMPQALMHNDSGCQLSRLVHLALLRYGILYVMGNVKVWPPIYNFIYILKMFNSFNTHLEESANQANYLVGGSEHVFYFSIYWEFHHPNWQTHIFQRGRYTTNQKHVQIFLQPSRLGKSWETAMRLYQAGQAPKISTCPVPHGSSGQHRCPQQKFKGI